jgi:hypothetical protein
MRSALPQPLLARHARRVQRCRSLRVAALQSTLPPSSQSSAGAARPRSEWSDEALTFELCSGDARLVVGTDGSLALFRGDAAAPSAVGRVVIPWFVARNGAKASVATEEGVSGALELNWGENARLRVTSTEERSGEAGWDKVRRRVALRVAQPPPAVRSSCIAWPPRTSSSVPRRRSAWRGSSYCTRVHLSRVRSASPAPPGPPRRLPARLFRPPAARPRPPARHGGAGAGAGPLGRVVRLPRVRAVEQL